MGCPNRETQKTRLLGIRVRPLAWPSVPMETKSQVGVQTEPSGLWRVRGADTESLTQFQIDLQTTGEALLIGHKSWVSSVAFSPDGNTLVSGDSDQIVRLWDAHTGAHLRTLTPGIRLGCRSVPMGIPSQVGFRLLDAHTGEHKRALTVTGHTVYIYSVAFSPDGNSIAIGSTGGTVRLWDAHTGEHKRTLTGHTGDVTSIAFSPGWKYPRKWGG